tara:strand:+ start:317 stop:907 length:591 start_codon:yes stop_codon:yes gene_type:complete
MPQTTTILSCNATPSVTGFTIMTELNLASIDVGTDHTSIGLVDLNSTITTALDNISLGAGSTIVSVTSRMDYQINGGSGITHVIQLLILDSGGSTLYTDTFGPTNATGQTGNTMQTYTGTARTTSDGSSAWTESDINGLQLKLNFAAESGGNQFGFVGHMGLTVITQSPPIIQGKIHQTSGITRLTSGKIILKDIL